MKGRDNKPHIGVFGRRNYGKSSLINAITGQNTSITSPVAGTTTDPVKKSIEIFGIGPVILIDTAGIDDLGALGAQRVDKSVEILKIVDFAIIVINDYNWGEPENTLTHLLSDYGTPFVIVNNKCDECSQLKSSAGNNAVVNVSAKNKLGIDELIAEIVRRMPESAWHTQSLLGDVISENDTVVLVTPIDSEAPEGRLILPQVQTIRDILDNRAIAIVLQHDKLQNYLKSNPAPKLVITDSQVFGVVAPIVPPSVPLTSFSIVLAHHKGDFENYLKGTPQICNLQDGDKILMLESCTHQTSCDDIGRVKIPRLLQKYTGKRIEFVYVTGLDKIPDIKDFAMVVQCGGCMVTHKQLVNRLRPAIEKGIPVTNYGMLLAYVNGIFDRAVQIFLKVENQKEK
ncbi:MAG: [FeFe] hydrogenase H-cluster maturation GTPase HydF [Bacteroidales bacterium]|nr:[FeFe] hydrogenase H-cluster maturation GTPase HydF [Bacteroidales bacterium]